MILTLHFRFHQHQQQQLAAAAPVPAPALAQVTYILFEKICTLNSRLGELCAAVHSKSVTDRISPNSWSGAGASCCHFLQFLGSGEFFCNANRSVASVDPPCISRSWLAPPCRSRPLAKGQPPSLSTAPDTDPLPTPRARERGL